jgi:hypothetical protein
MELMFVPYLGTDGPSGRGWQSAEIEQTVQNNKVLDQLQ